MTMRLILIVKVGIGKQAEHGHERFMMSQLLNWWTDCKERTDKSHGLSNRKYISVQVWQTRTSGRYGHYCRTQFLKVLGRGKCRHTIARWARIFYFKPLGYAFWMKCVTTVLQIVDDITFFDCFKANSTRLYCFWVSASSSWYNRQGSCSWLFISILYHTVWAHKKLKTAPRSSRRTIAGRCSARIWYSLHCYVL